jgi:ribonuclease E
MRESIRKDRARIQIGRISNFGLLEMTRQRLREGSIKWETNLALESFALKIVKKIEMLAFTERTKQIIAKVPEKIKLYIDNALNNEINYFQKKFGFKIEISGDPELIIPEFSIRLLNKSKKLLNKIENLNKNEEIARSAEKTRAIKKEEVLKKATVGKKDSTLKVKKNKSPRTLWTRKKKKKAA